jgi:chemosensory pili system protein ChpB (putative protein-glutamate methylesterase)
MAERAPVTETQRVALLARPGKAADNLADALRQAGAELVLVADPNGLDEAGLLASQPQAVLVALEPGIEQAIDRLDSVLSSPELTVIFDEADLAAHRAGWDAARWVRHLSAKLHRHQRVLPPGGEADLEEWHPSPGQLPKPSADFAGLDFDAFAQEAAVRADAVPVDGIQFDAVVKPSPSYAEAMVEVEAPVGVAETFDTPDADTDAVASDIASSSISQTVPALEVMNDEAPAPAVDIPTEWVLDEAMQSEADIPRGESNERTLDPPSLQPMQFDDDAFFLETLSAEKTENTAIDALSETDFEVDLDDDFDIDTPNATLEAPSDLSPQAASDFEFELPAGFDAPEPQSLATDFEFSDRAHDENAIALSMQEPAPSSLTDADIEAEPAGFALDSFGELSLANDDAATTMTVSERQLSEAAVRDLSSLEARISHLSLVDIEAESDAPVSAPVEPISPVDTEAQSAAAMPPPVPTNVAAVAAPTSIGFRGIVLIEAGLGGPDPVRQVLSALPPSFPLPVLVRLHLQGGRYDRLVTQMERASSLPVVLAVLGEHVRAGCIYFLPEGVGLRALPNGMEFIAHPSPARTIFAALPAEDSAVLFLSGSDSSLIEEALQAAEAGALVIAQSPEDCYDGAACAQLRSQGAASGVPSELANRLLNHWTS